MRTLDQLISESPVFAGLKPAQLELIVGCARNVGFNRGDRLFRDGEAADTFYLLRRGRVALTMHVPARGDVSIETLDPGEVVGWSWLFPPYTWHFDARALDDVRTVAFDGACLRGKCDDDAALGYALMRRFAEVMIDRLQHTRIRLLDLYGDVSDS
jgi:CRP/FNR family cyclic AMP-dependent transcriptional regulator